MSGRALAGLMLFQPTPHPAASPDFSVKWVNGLRTQALGSWSSEEQGTLNLWAQNVLPLHAWETWRLDGALPSASQSPLFMVQCQMTEAATLIVLLTEFSPPWFSRKDPGAITINPIKFLLVGFLITVARQSSGNTSRSSEWWVLGGEGPSPPCCLLSLFLKLSNLGVIGTNCWRGTWSILWETVVNIHHLEMSLGRTCCWCGIYFAASVSSCLSLPDALLCPLF